MSGETTAKNLPPPIPFTTLRGHQDAVNSIEFFDEDDGASRLVSGAADGEVKVWDLSIKRAALTLKAHDQPVLSVHALGAQVGSSSRDGTFKLWDIESASQSPAVMLKTGCEHFCPSASNKENLIVTPDSNSQILLWDIRADTSAPVGIFSTMKSLLNTGLNGMVTTICMANGTDFSIIGGYEDASIIQFDTRTFRALREYKKGLEPVLAIAIKPSSMDSLVIGGGDTQLTKLSTEDGKSISETKGGFIETYSAELSGPGTSSIKYRSDGRIIVSGHWDQTMRIFDQKKLKPLAIIGHHVGGVYSIAFAKGSAGYTFASSSKDKTIALWNLFEDSYVPR